MLFNKSSFRFILPTLFLFGAGAAYVFASTTAPAVITGVQAINIIGPGAQITWTTDDPSDSLVLYDVTTAGFTNTSTSRCDAGGMVVNHCVNLIGLSASMTYFYKVRSVNPPGYIAEQIGTFMSAGVSTGGWAATSSIPLAPSNLRLNGSPTASMISLLWDDNSLNEDKFNVERKLSTDSVYPGTFLGQLSANTTSYTDSSSLLPGTHYDYRVQSCLSGYGCSAYVYLNGVSTISSGDATAPTPPSLSAYPYSSTQVNLSFLGATDNVGVVGYKIFRNNTYLTSVSGGVATYSDTGVSGGAAYVYYVKAVDAAANESLSSPSVSVTTPAAALVTTTTTTTSTSGDTTAPVVSSMYAVNIMSSGAQIIWMTDDLSDSRVVYDTTSHSGNSYSNTTASRCDSGGNVTNQCMNLVSLSPSARYYYRVFSRNALGLETMSSESSFVSAAATSFTETTTAVASTTSTITSSTVVLTSTSGGTLVSATVSRGESYCEGSIAKTPVTFSVTPVAGAFFRVTMNAYSNETFPGMYMLPNGTYYWQAIARSGYALSGGISDSFVLSKSCTTPTGTTSLITTTRTTATAPIRTTQASLTKITSSTPVIETVAKPTTSISIQPVTAIPESGTSSATEIFSLFAQTPAVNTIATPEQYVHYCDDPAHQKECAQYAVKQIITLEVIPTSSLVTPEVFTSMESQGKLPGGAASPKELKAVCGQSAYASSCADLYVTTHVLNQEEANNHKAELLAMRKGETQVLTERVGARMFQDSDGDGITDYDEVNIYHTDPKNPDTNGDGILDGQHLLLGTDPLLVMPMPATSTSPKATTSQPVAPVVSSKITYEDPKFSGDAKPELLMVTNVKAVPVNIPGEGTTSITLALSGSALPNSFVTLFIFSEPIVVTVKADESGAWTYVLNKELPDGTHQVMSAITDGGGHILAKSAPLPFVKEAAAVSIGSPLLAAQPEAPGFFSGGSLYVLIATLVGVFTLALVLIGFIVKRHPLEKVSAEENTEHNNFFP